MLEEKDFKRLIQLAQNGDAVAKEEILQNNFNLVRSIVYRFMNRGYEWDDLFQIGCMGLMKAVERFNVSYGVQFSTYAVPMIIGEIRRFLRDDSPVKVSRTVKEFAFEVLKIQERLQGALGREPTINEIATAMNAMRQDIIAALEAIQVPTSIYTKIRRDNGDAILLLDQMKYCREQDPMQMDRLALREIISRLPEKEQKVIRLRFFEDLTQSEIARMIGLSQVQISRIEKNALRLIKEYMEVSAV
jgi:RNA polymerase sporulation-specific sigma factor